MAITLALMMATSLGLSSGALRARADGGAYVENDTVTIEGNVDYVTAIAEKDEVTGVTVEGNVESKIFETGIDVSARDNGSVTVTTGDVSASK